MWIGCCSFSRSRKLCIAKSKIANLFQYFWRKKNQKKIWKIFDQSECAIPKFWIWRQKGCQMKAYDPLNSKLSSDKKLIKNFPSYRSLNIWNFRFFQNFWRKIFFSHDIGMPRRKIYIQMKAHIKLHKINFGRNKMSQPNTVKNLIKKKFSFFFLIFEEKWFFTWHRNATSENIHSNESL